MTLPGARKNALIRSEVSDGPSVRCCLWFSAPPRGKALEMTCVSGVRTCRKSRFRPASRAPHDGLGGFSLSRGSDDRRRLFPPQSLDLLDRLPGELVARRPLLRDSFSAPSAFGVERLLAQPRAGRIDRLALAGDGRDVLRLVAPLLPLLAVHPRAGPHPGRRVQGVPLRLEHALRDSS